MGEQWYCKIVGQEVGPVTSEDLVAMLASGQIDTDDPVRAGTAGAWRPVKEVLGGAFRSAGGVVTAVAAESQWYCRMLGDEFGPYTFRELKKLAAESQLSPKDDVREGRDGTWQRASEVRALFKRREKPQGSQPRRRAVGSADDLLAGLADLEDADDSHGDFEADIDLLENADHFPSARSGSPAAGRDDSPANDAASRAEMLQRLDSEYRRLRTQIASGEAVEPPSLRTRPDSSDRPDPSGTAAPAARSAVPEPRRAAPAAVPASRAVTAPKSDPAFARTAEPEPSPPSPAAADSRSAAANAMRELAAAQVRSAQASSRPAPRPTYSGSKGGGSSFDFSSINLTGKPVLITAAVASVLAVGYFGMNLGFLSGLSAGPVYDETVKLHAEFKAASAKGPAAGEFAAFYDQFKPRHTALLTKIGNPSAGSTAYDAKQAVQYLGSRVESFKMKLEKSEQEMYQASLEQFLAKLKTEFGR